MSDIKAFTLELDKFGTSIPVEAIKAHQRIHDAVRSRVIARSPVDTGRYRASHQSSEGEPSTAIGPGTQLRITQAYGRSYLANNLPYAVPLENGHSKQAPAGVYAISIEEVRTILESGRLP